MFRILRILAVLLALVGVTAAACRPDNAAQPAPTPTQSNDTPDQYQPSDERVSLLKVPNGMQISTVQFADVDTGYALFLSCPKGCTGALFVTLDGGFSWLQREFPAGSQTTNLKLYPVDHSTVLLHAEGDAWYVSRDTGRTFTSSLQQPVEWRLIAGPVQTRCADGSIPGDASGAGQSGTTPGCGQRAVRVAADGERPLATQPPLPGRLQDARLSRDGRIWAVAEDRAMLYTAASADGGRTWTRQNPVTAPPQFASARLYTSPDGQDVWLTSSGATGAPLAWWFDQTGWQPQSELPTMNPDLVTFAAAGGGALAVGLGFRIGYLLVENGKPRWVPEERPRSVGVVGTLPDGTLIASRGAGERWLSTGRGFNRSWVHVSVDAST
jgi:photosystem II stability/assembly factor-like uncharacterized protein